MNALSVNELLEQMADGGSAERVWTGSRLVWLIDGMPCTRAFNVLNKRGLLATYYPTGKGFANLNEAGRKAAGR